MQNNDSRKQKVSYSRNTPAAKIGRSSVLLRIQRAVLQCLAMHEDLPTRQVVEIYRKDADVELSASVRDILEGDLYAQIIRAERRKRTIFQLQLPGFEHLPLKIPDAQGVPILLIDASFTRVRAYYRSLMIAHKNRRINDPKIVEAKTLMEEMRKASMIDKSITVKEVIAVRR
jgi:hypothetical protein